jgi:Glyoxalase-like domain
VRIDHLILAVADLDAAAVELRARGGLATVPGGEHPAWGTRNAIVPLGDAYLELVTVADAERARGSAFGRAVAQGAGTLVGFAVQPADFDAATARAGVDRVRGRRVRPDGSELRWSMAGAEEALPRGLPFFLRWDDPAGSPSRAPAPHAVAPAGIAWLSWPADPQALDAWLGPGHGLPIRQGPPRAAVALAGGGEVLVPA